jgi:hypothetical protein
MGKHFCTCPAIGCSNHPSSHNDSCDACIQKILSLGEVPGCIWMNAKNGVVGTTQWSMGNFAKAYLECNLS